MKIDEMMDFDDEESSDLENGCYVRDKQDGEDGEIFQLVGDPTERRVRIHDKDGRGWYIAPYRLVKVDDNDPAIARWFPNETVDETAPDWNKMAMTPLPITKSVPNFEELYKKVVKYINTNQVRFTDDPAAEINDALKKFKINLTKKDREDLIQTIIDRMEADGNMGTLYDDPIYEGKMQEHIVKVGNKFRLVSKKSGKNLGTYPTRAGAEKRERQVQYFKHAGESVDPNLEESSGKRCMQCGMKNCKCPGNSCKCKPIKGWVPGKGFKKDLDEAANPAQQAAIAINMKKKHKKPKHVKEAVMKEIFSDLEDLDDEEFQKEYGMTKDQARTKYTGSHRRTHEGDPIHEGVIVGKSEDGDPMNPIVAVLGGAGAYPLKHLYKKAEREAASLAEEIKHGSFKSAAHHVKQLENTLNTIRAAHDELAALRKRGGRSSRGIPPHMDLTQ